MKKGLKSSLSGNSKVFLLVCLITAFVADFAVTLVLLIAQTIGLLWLFPLLFAVIDAIFILQAVFSNFRFKYTVAEIVLYIAFSIVVSALTFALTMRPGAEQFFTVQAAALWLALHFISIVGALVCYLYAAKIIRGKSVLKSIVAFFFSAVCVGATAYYAMSFFNDGFTGQGSELITRPLAYEFDGETDGYTVTRALSGRGTSIRIPYEFNGKKVTQIAENVFLTDGVDSITIDCDPDVEIVDYFAAGYSNDNLTVYVPKENIDAFKNNLYTLTGTNVSYLSLFVANRTVPYGLDDDELYVTFAYERAEFDKADGNVIPTYIGKKGEKISFPSEMAYVQHADAASDEDLYWCSENNGGLIMRALVQDGKDVSNAVLTENIKAVDVSFENVYKVYPVSADFSSSYVNNDSAKYSFEQNFVYSAVNGSTLGYKLTVAEHADEILAQNGRLGFEVDWWYANGSNSGTYSRVESLKTIFERGLSYDTPFHTPDYITLAPHWELKQPEISLSTNYTDNTVVYGDQLTVSSDISSEIALTYTYNWEFVYNSSPYGLDSPTPEFSIQQVGVKNGFTHITMNNGDYALTVTGTNKELTDLSVNKTEYISVKVKNRTLRLEWTFPDDLVYDGTEKDVRCNIIDGLMDNDASNVGLLNGGKIANVKDAGEYGVAATLYNPDGLKYEISAEDVYRTLTIDKAPLFITYGNYEHTYDGDSHGFMYTIEGAKGNDKSSLSVQRTTSQSLINAGTYNLTTALVANRISSNYYIEDGCEKVTVIINPCPVTASWSVSGFVSGDSFVYDGTNHTVTATAVGISGILNLSVSPQTVIRNAGTYNLTASVNNSNYIIQSNEQKSYTISKASARVQFGDREFEYDGRPHSPECYIVGVGSDGNISVTGIGSGTDVNDYSYDFSQWTHANYELDGIAEQVSYSITPCVVSVSWTSAQFSYDGTAKSLTATASGIGGIALSLQLEYYSNNEGKTVAQAIDAGGYRCTARLVAGSNYDLKNYSLYNDSVSFEISRAYLIVTADSKTITEGGALPELTYNISNLKGNDKQSDFADLITVKVVGYNGSAGSYSIVVANKDGDTNDTPAFTNYVLRFVSGTLTVNERPAEVN